MTSANTVPSEGTPKSVREFTRGAPRRLVKSINNAIAAVGQGTVLRKRRPERTKVDDVSITEATGLTLGEDGYPHPLETDARGRLKTFDQETRDFMEELMLTNRAILVGLARQLNCSVAELADEAVSSTELFGI